ncbi:phosphotransferase [Evansella sp. LMS18]|uniref:phosphotransferase n=1 Tax=Evansella sp. LMS18 TaxID=2924033 RepID=UPI0034E93EC2
MKLLEHLLGEEWNICPAGGATGEAYIAENGDQKIFIKRNSSPFLAVLSAEGIVPKLLWTKRLENGDVLTAQRWIKGRELKSPELRQKRVARLLAKIHRSRELLDMFTRMGNHPLTPQALFKETKSRAVRLQIKDPYITEALKWLEKNLPESRIEEHVVCHADVNHNNWIISSEDSLYLIDWDGATVADPALDLAPMLYLYVPENEWGSWLKEYGVTYTPELKYRLDWYMAAHCVESMLWHWQRQEFHDITKWSDILTEIIRQSRFHSS